MNVEKVKEALEIGLNAVTNQGWTRNQDKEIYLISDAIAELEKPAEDDAAEVASSVFGIEYVTAEEWHTLAAQKIQQYAESYHAKKCAEYKEFMADNGPEREA